MNAVEIGIWIGAIAGGLGGIAGGVIGTYFGIKKTQGLRERAFMIKVSVVGWILGLAFVGLLLALPPTTSWVLWIPYAIVLPLGLRHTNKRQQQIRNEEAQARRAG